MDSRESHPVASRLHHSKCTCCRKDKKKFLPHDHPSPGEVCDVCFKYHYTCFASMTAGEERLSQQLRRDTGLDFPPHLYNTHLSSFGTPRPHPNPYPPTQPASATRANPGCASYFRILIKAPWHNFGLPMLPAPVPEPGAIAIEMANMESLYGAFQSRLQAVELGRRYKRHLQAARSTGMPLDDARAYTNRQIIYEVGQESHDPTFTFPQIGNGVDFIRDFDWMLSVALRWVNLIDAVGVPEVLLMNFNDNLVDVGGYATLPDLTWATAEEWSLFMSHLLSPALRLKETCWKLSGVADLVQCLRGYEDLELRRCLAGLVQKRVRDVLGDGENLSGYEDESDGDEDMPDFD